jgi:putative alpha-1,2-mannosidase
MWIVGGEGFGIGSTPPGVQYPFGLVRLSPDSAGFGNVALGGEHFGGYHYGGLMVGRPLW